MVPEAPPPTIATAARRSDFVVRPILRVRRARLPPHHVVVHAGNRLAGGLREEPRHDRMDQAGNPGTDQPYTNIYGTDAVPPPAHAKRARMLEEQAVRQSAIAALLCRHAPGPYNVLATPAGFEPVALGLGTRGELNPRKSAINFAPKNNLMA